MLSLTIKRKIMVSAWRQGLCAASLLLSAACPPVNTPDAGEGGDGDGGAVVSRSDFLRAAGECSRQNVTSFRTQAEAFAAAPTQETWRSAMRAWSRLEPMQFGPTALSITPGGQDLREHIYSWPLVSRCDIDGVLKAGSYSGGVSRLLINRRGLWAAEYLLFSNPDEVCAPTAEWNALSTEERAARKQAYAQAVADDVAVRARTLDDAWSGFAETLATAGSGNATYPTVQGALNRVSDAVFYVEREVKDIKLATPLGLRDCAAPPCLDKLESQFAAFNTEHLAANLQGARQLLEGCDDETFAGVGFDDLLVAQGAGELARSFRTNAAAAQASLDALNGADLSVALVDSPEAARAVYDAFKGVTDLLKSEFVTVLDLDLPMGLEGDND